MTLVALLFLIAAFGKVILLLTTFEKTVWDSVQVLGLVSWVLGFILALQVIGALPTITLG
jgi:hypothetical protein